MPHTLLKKKFDKQHRCNVCNFTFGRNEHLQNHIATKKHIMACINNSLKSNNGISTNQNNMQTNTKIDINQSSNVSKNNDANENKNYYDIGFVNIQEMKMLENIFVI